MENPLKKKKEGRKVETVIKDGKEVRKITRRSGNVVYKKPRKVKKTKPEKDYSSSYNNPLEISGSGKPKDKRTRKQKIADQEFAEGALKKAGIKPMTPKERRELRKRIRQHDKPSGKYDKGTKDVEKRKKWKEKVSNLKEKFKPKKKKIKLKGKKKSYSPKGGGDSSPTCKEGLFGKFRKKCKLNV